MLKRNLFQPWVLVALGVTMNIISALIVHILVEHNRSRMDILLKQSSTVAGRIDTLWQNYRSLEQRQVYFTTLLLSANPGEQLETANELVHESLQNLAQKYQLNTVERLTPGALQLDTLQVVFAPIQRQLINSIDTVYLEKIDIEKQRAQLDEQSHRLNSVALFLQLFGLILVLARDLARHN